MLNRIEMVTSSSQAARRVAAAVKCRSAAVNCYPEKAQLLPKRAPCAVDYLRRDAQVLV